MSLDEIKEEILNIKENVHSVDFGKKNQAIKAHISAIGSCEERSRLLEWLMQEKFSDNPFVMKIIGNLYEEEDASGKIDKQTAITYYIKAMELGYFCISEYVGYLYYSQNNYLEALKWFHKAIENRNNKTIFVFLYKIYKEGGFGVERNHILSFKYLQMGAELEDESCMFYLGVQYLVPSFEGIVVDYVMAMKWFLKTAENGCHSSCLNIGSLYYFGLGVNKDIDQALAWYELGANDAASSWILYQIGIIYASKKNDIAALEWYKRAADQGSIDALWNSALIHKELGNKVDAIDLFLKAYQKYPEKENKELCRVEISKIILDDELNILNQLLLDSERNKMLAEENERLSAELSFRPGGSGYVAAKEHFESSVNIKYSMI
ncbi:MAG: sel1 repeat family protein [Harvfovirus sp.]|uniref:Sel1 repeat family protein n=1 Tax=Harvfovirus sp. TaxID=2487768 RepID=A0A3G5A292_9VIRU|nr:MAG: sel1 repeat family protein [Harvfovirus sp.]